MFPEASFFWIIPVCVDIICNLLLFKCMYIFPRNGMGRLLPVRECKLTSFVSYFILFIFFFILPVLNFLS